MQELNELPVIRRGLPALEMNNESYEVTTYEPLPVRHSQFVSAKLLNDLKMLDRSALTVWATNTTDRMRRRYLKTVEALCAVALTGKIEWPIHMPGRREYETYLIDFGTPYRLDMAGLQTWNASDTKIFDVFRTLKAMRKILMDAGYGAELEIWPVKRLLNSLRNLRRFTLKSPVWE